MKPPAGQARPRRKTAQRQVRLDLRRAATPPPPPEDEMLSRRRSSFWKWFLLVALFHFFLFALVMWLYRPTSVPTPPIEIISLLPEGETVRGTPGRQAAPKVGASTPAPAAHHHHHEPKPPTPPQPVAPPPPQAITPPPEKPQPQPKPLIHEDHAPLVETKPKPVKPTPAKPKIKVDLHLADGPLPAPEKPAKPKHLKKTPPVAEDSQDLQERDASNPDNVGLSKEEIAAKLGEKLRAAGITNAEKTGISGSAAGHSNPFADFYASIHDQVMNKWQEPNLDDAQANNPIVQIHVERDGRVPPEQVMLLTSSGNQQIDDSALGAARNLGYTLQPLPDGCPPDISITFKLTH